MAPPTVPRFFPPCMHLHKPTTTEFQPQPRPGWASPPHPPPPLPGKALRQHYAGTRFEEQRQLHLPQKHKATVPESTLRVEMNALEEQADNAKAQAHIRQRCLRPSAMGDVCLHDARFGGSRALLPPPPP
jgi:hypothetical protein